MEAHEVTSSADYRATIRDLVALSSLPALWTTQSPTQILDSLAEVMVGMLRLDFAYGTLRVVDAEPIEVARTLQRRVGMTKQLSQVLAPWLKPGAARGEVAIPNPLGPGQVQLAVAPIGLGIDAMLVGASTRADFPAERDRLLLSVGANQAAVAIQRWRSQQALRDQEEQASASRRKEVERERRQSARLEQMFQLAPSFMAMLRGPEHIFELVNDAYVRLLGGRSMVGLAVREAVPEVEGQGYFELLDRVFETGEPFVARRSPVSLVSPQGEIQDLFVDLVYQPLTGVDGEVTGIFVEGSDVTDHVHNEERLALSEESQRLATAAAEVGTWDLDITTDTLTWSDRTKAMFGISPEVPCSMTDFYDGLHPEDREATSAAFASALDPRQRITYDVEYRTIGKEDGRVRWVAAKGKGIFDDAGRCVRAIGTAIDISARKVAEAAAIEAAEQFANLADNVNQLVWMAEPDGSIFWYNKRWYDYTGTDLAAMKDWGWREVHHPDHIDRIIEEVRGNWAAGEPWGGTYLLRSAEGEYRWFLTRAEPIRSGAGQLVRWFGTNTDVTDQLATETALRDLTATLEQRVQSTIAEREEALARLHEAQKVETLGQLTGGVAHDFNNLLTPIMGGLEILSRKLAHDDRAQRIASAAMQSAERAKTLVQRLLSFGRRQTLQSRAVDLARLVEGMRDLIDRSLGPSVEITVDIPGDLPPVEIDPNQLELALLNLCVNARDAMEDGGRLTIAAFLVDPTEGSTDPECVALRISDTGKGMDEATLAKATEPFFTTKGVGQGTGLGLSMAYGLAAQSGGKLTITSVVGKGTTVELVLPVADAAAEVQPVSDAPVIDHGVGTVLLVDDEELVRMSIADGLRDLGYKVVEAASAAGALEHLREGLVPDVLVTDHMMPGMTGAHLAREVRGKLPGLPMLMITGYANLRPEETRGLEVIAKPFRRGDLAARIAELIKQSEGGNVVRLHSAARPKLVD